MEEVLERKHRRVNYRPEIWLACLLDVACEKLFYMMQM